MASNSGKWPIQSFNSDSSRICMLSWCYRSRQHHGCWIITETVRQLGPIHCLWLSHQSLLFKKQPRNFFKTSSERLSERRVGDARPRFHLSSNFFKTSSEWLSEWRVGDARPRFHLSLPQFKLFKWFASRNQCDMGFHVKYGRNASSLVGMSAKVVICNVNDSRNIRIHCASIKAYSGGNFNT